MSESNNKIEIYVKKMLLKQSKFNKLIDEKSPYLLQHAFNPVNWYPWGEEAFEISRKENKPIFLSIGYSTCHWCHVMAHESFEDSNTAEIMNRYFVNIKVDREERPDVDGIYMRITQAMTGSGGWPMSLFLTPDLKPIFAGTYFPAQRKYHIPAFQEILYSIHNAWQEKEKDIILSAEDITRQISISSNDQAEIGIKECNKAIESFKSIYDSVNGGFGNAPKFPQPAVLNFLLIEGVKKKDKSLIQMSIKTLISMAEGGLFDQLGGGFHRYSVDNNWRISHFEKMLYDQAQLIETFSKAWCIKEDKLFKDIVYKTINYLNRDMLSIEGGYYSAEDADSIDPYDENKKTEGAFYLWRYDEILELLGEKRGRKFCEYYGVKMRGNAPLDPHGEFINKNVLYVNDEENLDNFSEERKILFNKREKRVRPHLDDKILTDWNSLTISSLVNAGIIFNDMKLIELARKSASFILQVMYDRKELKHSYRDKVAKVSGKLSDYAFLVNALIDLYESTGEIEWLQQSVEILDMMLDKFEDKAKGGFYEAEEDSSLIFKYKDSYDGAIPSANSVAIKVLIKIGTLLNNTNYKNIAEKALMCFGGDIKKAPAGSVGLLNNISKILEGEDQIVIASNNFDGNVKNILMGIKKEFINDPVIILLTSEINCEWLRDKNSNLENMIVLDGKPTIYHCKNYTCNKPVHRVKELL